jgi:hypothetical protein
VRQHNYNSRTKNEKNDKQHVKGEKDFKKYRIHSMVTVESKRLKEIKSQGKREHRLEGRDNTA